MMLTLVLIGTVFTLWLWSRSNRNNDEPPLASESKILIGHALKFAGDSNQLYNTFKNFSKEALECGGVIKTTIGPRVLYIITDPEDCTTVSNECLQKDAIYDFAKSWIGDGLVTSPPSKWKVHRKLLNPAFSQQVVDSFMDVFNQQSRSLINNLKVEVGKGQFDFWAYAKQSALETICLTALGLNIEEKSIENIEYLSALTILWDILITRFQKFWLHNNVLFSLSSLKRKQEECITILHKVSNTILKQRKKCLTNSISNVKNTEETTKGRKFKTFMDLLLELSADTNVFTDRLIREHVDTIIVAGHDTSATSLFYCILLVGSYPQVQKKIHEELHNIFGDDDRDVTKQDLSQLVYLEAVIKESIRMYPVIAVYARYVHKDIKLRYCTLFKGNSVYLSIYGLNRHPMWGPDVEEFRPERWFDSCVIKQNPYVSASFGIGRRNCIGKTYALMSMKITLVHLYRNYIVHGDHTKLKFKLDGLLKPASEYNITIEKRK